MTKRPRRGEPLELPPLELVEREPRTGEAIVVTVLVMIGLGLVGMLLFDLRLGDIGHWWMLPPLTGLLLFVVWRVLNR